MGHGKFLRTGMSMLMGLFILGSLLAACGGSGSGTTSTGSGGCSSPPKLVKKAHYKVGFSQQVNNAPWRIAETNSVLGAIKSHGDTAIFTDANNSDSKQVSDIQSIIAQHPDVLLISPLTESGEVSAIKQAAKACIPVILLDRDADHSQVTPGKDYVTFIGSDFVKEGQRVADWMIQDKNGSANIIELQGTTGSSPAINRTDGFNNEIKSHQNMKIIAAQDANFDQATALKVMQTLLQSHPTVNAVYAENDEMALGAIKALKAAGKLPGKDVTVASIDGENGGLQAIIAGEEGTVIQCNPRLGPDAYQVINDYANGKTIPSWVVVNDNQYTSTNAQQAYSQGLGF
jgi:galactofuranose transport system substrate-binding protein